MRLSDSHSKIDHNPFLPATNIQQRGAPNRTTYTSKLFKFVATGILVQIASGWNVDLKPLEFHIGNNVDGGHGCFDAILRLHFHKNINM